MILSKNLRGVLWICLAVACNVLVDLFVKLVNAQLPLTQLLWIRALTTLCFFVPAVMYYGWGRIKMHAVTHQLVRGVMWYLSLFLIFYALRQMSIAEVNLLVFLEVMLTVFLASLFLHEPLSIRKILAGVLGLIGVYITSYPHLQGFSAPLGIVAALLAALSLSAMTLLTKSLTRSETNFSLLFWPQVFALVLLGPWVAYQWITTNPIDWLYITLVGVAALSANYCFLRAMRIADASVVAPAVYSALPFAMLVDLVVFQLVPGYALWLGAVFILTSLLIIDRSR